MGVSEDFIWAINRSIKVPDKVILLDFSAKEALERIKGREVLTKYQNVEFLEKVRRKFLEIAEREKERFIIVDASRSPEKVKREVYSRVEEIIGESLSV